MPIFKYTFFSLIPQKTFLFFFFFNLHGKFKLKLFKISSFTQWILKKNKMNRICVYWSLKFWFQIIQEKKYYATWFFEKIKRLVFCECTIYFACRQKTKTNSSINGKGIEISKLTFLNASSEMCLFVSWEKKIHFFSSFNKSISLYSLVFHTLPNVLLNCK